MVLEGLVSTLDDSGAPHVRPMGPIVPGRDFDRLVLRPYRTSTTYKHLKARGEGAFHVVDDAILIAQATLGTLPPDLATVPAQVVNGRVLSRACRWWEFRVETLSDAEERTTIAARVVASGESRPFFGPNRALHAVIEAAILSTRLHLIDAREVLEQLRPLSVLVDKTGGPEERAAFDLLEARVRSQAERLGSASP